MKIGLVSLPVSFHVLYGRKTGAAEAMVVLVVRDIEPGEEISINYGKQFFQADEAVP